MSPLDLPAARRIWYARQGLADPRPMAAADRVARHGWLRTFGGNAYISAWARDPSFRRAGLDEAVFQAEALLNVPSVHSCVMLVPAAEARYSLSAAVDRIEKDTARIGGRCGVDEAELEGLAEQVMGALGSEAMTPDELRKRLPEGAVRDLGAEGKKQGESSSLGLAIKRLAARGRVQRLPVGDRLDGNRLRYRPFRASPWGEEAVDRVPPEELDRELVGRYLRWAAPAGLEEIMTWADVGKRRVAAALEKLGAVALRLERPDGGDAEAWALPGDPFLASPLPAPTRRFAFLPVDDNLMGLRTGTAALLDAADRAVEVAGKPASSFRWWDYHVLVEDGAIRGLWGWHPLEKRVAWRAFRPLAGEHRAEVEARAAELAAFIMGELGGLKQSSLDSEKSQLRRVAEIEALPAS
jgi:hypothetical protein